MNQFKQDYQDQLDAYLERLRCELFILQIELVDADTEDSRQRIEESIQHIKQELVSY